MSRKFAVLMVVVIVVSSMLSACGSSSNTNGTQNAVKAVSEAAKDAGVDLVKDNVVRCYNLASDNGKNKVKVEFVESKNTGRFMFSFSAYDAECGLAQSWTYFIAWYQDGKLDTVAKH